MNYAPLIQELEELVRQLGLAIRYEKGDFDGGYCILKDQRILVVNKRLQDNRKASVIARAVAEVGIDTTFVRPNLREYIEDEVAKAAKERKAS